MSKIIDVQQKLSAALKVQKEADMNAEAAQHDYDFKLLEFEAQNQDVFDDQLRTKTLKVLAKKTVDDLRTEARELLEVKFIDELPAGFTQKRTIDIIYNRRDMRLAALAHFHHLLVLDEKAVDKFIKDNATPSKEHDDLLIVSDNIRDLIAVDTFYKPMVAISNAVLLKLDKS